MGIVGDGRGWLVGKIQRGEGGSDMVWVGEQRDCIGSEKWGREEVSSFLFSVRWLGVGAME
ncbi:MAG TPA: hypothetical protein DDY31_07075 [Lachnospiraceae bacterium]|nr:hypothetical protein [Lachnospiraceae bacterium]